MQGRIVGIAREKKAVVGRKMRVDTTVTETNIHYPTDSSLLLDGVRVLTRTMKRVVEIGGNAGGRVRDRMKSVGRRVMEIARIGRARVQTQGKERRQTSYKRLLHATGQVVAQAKRIANDVKKGVKKARKRVDQLRLEALQAELARMIPLVQQVMHQTKARLFRNDLHVSNKLVSLFETATQIIRKGRSAKPTEFGRLIKIQEAENQIITDYEVGVFVYVFGRYHSRRLIDPDATIRIRTIARPRSEWAVIIQDHHPAYIRWETFLANEQRLVANNTQKGARPAREGPALLQGMIACGACARAMSVRYQSGQAIYDCATSRADHRGDSAGRAATPDASVWQAQLPLPD